MRIYDWWYCFNFGAGFTGGIIYIYAPDKNIIENNLNKTNSALAAVNQGDLNKIQELLEEHLKNTNSYLAENLLIDFVNQSKKFIKIMPI